MGKLKRSSRQQARLLEHIPPGWLTGLAVPASAKVPSHVKAIERHFRAAADDVLSDDAREYLASTRTKQIQDGAVRLVHEVDVREGAGLWRAHERMEQRVENGPETRSFEDQFVEFAVLVTCADWLRAARKSAGAVRS